MPIECPIQFPRLEREEFQRLDYRVMACAFATHQQLGRSCDEGIYQRDMAMRLDEEGLGPSRIEVMIRVRHGGFAKDYKLDLAVALQAIYELKAVKAISAEHEAQTMNYLLLTDSPHGKVVNFRAPSVESRFVNNPLTREERYRHTLTEHSWRGPESLRQALIAIVEDIGLFLETPLYNQILLHHFGGPDHALERIPLTLNGRQLGLQTFQMCGPREAFRVTALSSNIRAQQTSFQKLLSLTNLKSLHWINLNRHEVQLATLTV